MKVIGLCGNSGSGKTTVCEYLWELQIPVIDADRVYAELLMTDALMRQRLCDAFSSEILDAAGNIDRKKLSAAVFTSACATEKREKLNGITHPFVIGKMKEKIREYETKGASLIFVDVPLLFESGFDKFCDYIVTVTAKSDLKIRRILERDRIGEEEAEGRIRAQRPDDFLISHSDFVIENDGTLDDLRQKTNEILYKIKEKP